MPVSTKVSPSDLYVKDKYVSEELRNLSKELGVLLVTASQLNRCLSLDTKIIRNGIEDEIRNVQLGDRLRSNGEDVTVTEILPITKQAVFKIKTKSGKEIICSDKHKFPTTNGLKTISTGLKKGDSLTVLLNTTATQ
jgi:intein/homing endonuclease